jgi:hypothetical protein
MMLAYTINIADRYVVSTVLEDIRLDLHLTRLAASAFLTGVSLALFYVMHGDPALVDRGPLQPPQPRSRSRSRCGRSHDRACAACQRGYIAASARRVSAWASAKRVARLRANSIICGLFPRCAAPDGADHLLRSARPSVRGSGARHSRAPWRRPMAGTRPSSVLGVPGVLLGLLIMATIRETQARPASTSIKSDDDPTLMETAAFLPRPRSRRCT